MAYTLLCLSTAITAVSAARNELLDDGVPRAAEDRRKGTQSGGFSESHGDFSSYVLLRVMTFHHFSSALGTVKLGDAGNGITTNSFDGFSHQPLFFFRRIRFR